MPCLVVSASSASSCKADITCYNAPAHRRLRLFALLGASAAGARQRVCFRFGRKCGLMKLPLMLFPKSGDRLLGVMLACILRSAQRPQRFGHVLALFVHLALQCFLLLGFEMAGVNDDESQRLAVEFPFERLQPVTGAAVRLVRDLDVLPLFAPAGFFFQFTAQTERVGQSGNERQSFLLHEQHIFHRRERTVRYVGQLVPFFLREDFAELGNKGGIPRLVVRVAVLNLADDGKPLG